MSQQSVALIVHEILDAPEKFKEDALIISNGYYKVHMDGSRYGMGISSYIADGSEREMLLKAVVAWKEETGWRPKEEEPEPERMPSVNMTKRDKLEIYSEFARTVKSHLKSFTIHQDSAIFRNGIEKAVAKMDSLINPPEK